MTSYTQKFQQSISSRKTNNFSHNWWQYFYESLPNIYPKVLSLHIFVYNFPTNRAFSRLRMCNDQTLYRSSFAKARGAKHDCSRSGISIWLRLRAWESLGVSLPAPEEPRSNKSRRRCEVEKRSWPVTRMTMYCCAYLEIHSWPEKKPETSARRNDAHLIDSMSSSCFFRAEIAFEKGVQRDNVFGIIHPCTSLVSFTQL